jgi:hypothetical protein
VLSPKHDQAFALEHGPKTKRLGIPQNTNASLIFDRLMDQQYDKKKGIQPSKKGFRTDPAYITSELNFFSTVFL